MRAPATNITDRIRARLRPALRGGQHRPQVPGDLQQAIARWNHDLVEEPAERLSRCSSCSKPAASVVAYRGSARAAFKRIVVPNGKEMLDPGEDSENTIEQQRRHRARQRQQK